MFLEGGFLAETGWTDSTGEWSLLLMNSADVFFQLRTYAKPLGAIVTNMRSPTLVNRLLVSIQVPNLSKRAGTSVALVVSLFPVNRFLMRHHGTALTKPFRACGASERLFLLMV
uniref:Uncharacterized protein n=1 Tax=Compsopogon caeruleus TaxID=31354 RepID=A0A7S1TIU0_9RHOD|mmetsp:Transcript_9606/g.19635  ORF Transcript_9606/g.19635 Transcript_9606/m.19635 type:complete len:114 (+) Transcript_9606:220-561(+)